MKRRLSSKHHADGIRSRTHDLAPSDKEKQSAVKKAEREAEEEERLQSSPFLKKMEEEKREFQEIITQEEIPASVPWEERADPLITAREEEARHQEHGRRHRIGNGRKIFKKTRVLAASAAVSVTVLAVILLSTVFARVTIVVMPRVEQVSTDIPSVIFDAGAHELDVANSKIPAEFFEFTHEAGIDAESTGEETVDQKSFGRVRIYNNFSSAPQALVAGTRVSNPEGKIYRLQKGIVIPGAKVQNGAIVAQFIETDVIADRSGPDFNAEGEARLMIPGFKGTPKYQGFYAIAPQGFSGGVTGKSRVVTRDDIARGQERATKKVFDELKADIAKKTPSQFKLIDSLELIEITSVDAPPEHTAGDNFRVTAHAVGRIVIFREEDILVFLKQKILAPDAARNLLPDTRGLRYRLKNMNVEKKRAEVAITGEMKARLLVPQDDLISLAKGRKEGSLIEILRGRKELASFRVAFFPPWIFKVPSNPAKIKLVVEEPKM